MESRFSSGRVIGGRTAARRWVAWALVAALVLIARSDGGASSARAQSTPSGGKAASAQAAEKDKDKPVTRTRSEVSALIEQAGKTPPEWFDSVEPNYPSTLDLTWAPGTPGKWEPQKNLGAYITSVVNPNPSKWREFIKLLHKVLTINKDNPQKLKQTMNTLAQSYQNYEQDWARAAFWWQKTGDNPIGLARCYWHLGCKEMATSVLKKVGADNTRQSEVIRLWSDMDEPKTALALAEAKARTPFVDAAYLAAGDVCRQHGEYKAALGFYQKVLDTSTGGRDLKNNKVRAKAAMDGVKVFDALDLSKVADGTYKGSEVGYRGPVEVEVVVKSGRIDSVRVTQHREDYCFTSVTEVPRQIVEKQGVKGVDTITGATISSCAIINATAKALASGMK